MESQVRDHGTVPYRPEMISILRAAYDRGITFFDCAEGLSKTRFEVLYWFLHRSKEKTRPLKNGENFNLAYTFNDPKDYANLNLVFGDVPPIPLEVPPDEKE